MEEPNPDLQRRIEFGSAVVGHEPDADVVELIVRADRGEITYDEVVEELAARVQSHAGAASEPAVPIPRKGVGRADLCPNRPDDDGGVALILFEEPPRKDDHWIGFTVAEWAETPDTPTLDEALEDVGWQVTGEWCEPWYYPKDPETRKKRWWFPFLSVEVKLVDNDREAKYLEERRERDRGEEEDQSEDAT